MRIAFVVGYFPALSETFVLNQITGLIDQGFEVDIYANWTRGEGNMHPDVIRYGLLERCTYFNPPQGKLKRLLSSLYLLPVNLHRGPSVLLDALNVFKYKQDALSMKQFYAALTLLKQNGGSQNRNYDIIYCHFGQNGNLGLFLKEKGLLGGKLVTTFHGFDMSAYIKSYGRNVYSRLLKKGDLFLPISRRWRTELVAMGCPEEKIAIHRMGIDPNQFTQSNKIGQGPVRLLSIARLVEKKGLDYAVRAAIEAIRLGKDIRYDIIGDGPQRGQLEQLIEQSEAGDRIRLLGAKNHEEVKQLIAKADLFLAPSVTGSDGDQEGIPVAIMEAMACGLPVLSTHHSGIPELVEDGVSGFLAPERNAQKLAQQIAELAEDPVRRRQMGDAGRRIVEVQYNLEQLNLKLGRMFRAFGTSRNGPPLGRIGEGQWQPQERAGGTNVTVSAKELF
ncbi:glycosyltransferase [Paenibacillus sp. GCM10012307]|uniref:Glycosyltransferase n=1 Tax=Paenibacillus roseus TaxID=2798579 RepID=A0A934IUX7_9BACL|nr:glycosyltransferase [Paenibacillus roseus]MBJ6359791.1 glycosyltransferase [Paenibacillus roseus]